MAQCQSSREPLGHACSAPHLCAAVDAQHDCIYICGRLLNRHTMQTSARNGRNRPHTVPPKRSIMPWRWLRGMANCLIAYVLSWARYSPYTHLVIFTDQRLLEVRTLTCSWGNRDAQPLSPGTKWQQTKCSSVACYAGQACGCSVQGV